LSCASPNVQHAHNLGLVVDREEDAVRVRIAAVREYQDDAIGSKLSGATGHRFGC
jgi:hypothetical protein